MTRVITITALVTLIIALAIASAASPCWLSDDGNSFLKNFVNHEFLSFLGVIVTITLASAASLHLEFNRLEDSTEEGFEEARGAVKAYAIMLMVLFAAAFLLVIFKPIFGERPTWSAAFNSSAIVIVTLNMLALADLTLTVFKIPADRRLGQ